MSGELFVLACISALNRRARPLPAAVNRGSTRQAAPLVPDHFRERTWPRQKQMLNSAMWGKARRETGWGRSQVFPLAHPDEDEPAGDGREVGGEKALDEHGGGSGGGLSTPAMTCSGREFDCSARIAHNVAGTATGSRTPSDPRRRRWPSPSGAKTTERQSRTARLATVTGSPATERLLTATADGESAARYAQDSPRDTGHTGPQDRQGHQPARNRAFLASAPQRTSAHTRAAGPPRRSPELDPGEMLPRLPLVP